MERRRSEGAHVTMKDLVASSNKLEEAKRRKEPTR
jgi:hypothetical protein